MRIPNTPRVLKSLAVTTALTATTLSGAQAAVIWEDDFSGSGRGATAPNPYNYSAGAAGNDYTLATLAGTENITYTVSGGLSGVLNIADTGTAGNTPTLTVSTNQFAPALYAAGTQFTVSYDIRVNSLTASNAASVPRFSIVNNNNVEVFTVGFSHASFTGAAAGLDALGFYYGFQAGDAVVASKGIGADTFNLGVYSSTTPANNDTNAGAGLDFFRVTFTLTVGSTAVTNGSITDLGNNASVAFPAGAALSTALTWMSSSTSGIRFVTGVSGTSNYDIDNVVVSGVPEPSAALLGGCGLLSLLRRRRRR